MGWLALAGGRPPDSTDEIVARLVMVAGPEVGRRWELAKDVSSIGAGHGCEVQLEVEGLPARCAVIEFSDAKTWSLTIERGTDVRVAGQREGTVPLFGSEAIAFGDAIVEFHTHAQDESIDRVTGLHKWRRTERALRSLHSTLDHPLTLAVLVVHSTHPPVGRRAFDEAMHRIGGFVSAASDGGLLALRYDDDKFVVLFVGADAATARGRVAAACEAVANTASPLDGSRGWGVRFGVSEVSGATRSAPVLAALEAALMNVHPR
jgi:GGDEF domain-containing protein